MSKNNGNIILGVVAFVAFFALAVAGYFGWRTMELSRQLSLSKQTSNISSDQVVDGNVLEKTSPAKIPIEKTIAWSKHVIVTESTLQLTDYQVEVPSSWERWTHSSNFQKVETFTDSSYKLTIQQDLNKDPLTGKPYTSLRDLTKLSYDSPIVTVGSVSAAKVLPRAGSESIFALQFFSPDNKDIFLLRLETPVDGSKVTEGEKLFGEIAARFKFIKDGTNTISMPPQNINSQARRIFFKQYGYSIEVPNTWEISVNAMTGEIYKLSDSETVITEGTNLIQFIQNGKPAFSFDLTQTVPRGIYKYMDNPEVEQAISSIKKSY